MGGWMDALPEAVAGPLLLKEGLVDHGGGAGVVGVGVDHRHPWCVKIHPPFSSSSSACGLPALVCLCPRLALSPSLLLPSCLPPFSFLLSPPPPDGRAALGGARGRGWGAVGVGWWRSGWGGGVSGVRGGGKGHAANDGHTRDDGWKGASDVQGKTAVQPTSTTATTTASFTSSWEDRCAARRGGVGGLGGVVWCACVQCIRCLADSRGR